MESGSDGVSENLALSQKTVPIELSVVMPCLNERLTLGTCIKKAMNSMEELGIQGEVIIADNGSTDGSQKSPNNWAHVWCRWQCGIRCGSSRRDFSGTREVRHYGRRRRQLRVYATGPLRRKVARGLRPGDGKSFKGGILPKAMPPLIVI